METLRLVFQHLEKHSHEGSLVNENWKVEGITIVIPHNIIALLALGSKF